jgi:hypothetical protein
MTDTNWLTWAQLYYDGAYNVLPELVDAGQGVTLTRGVADDLDIKPGVCTFRLNDDDDLYRPSNAASPYFGQTGPWMPGAFATGDSVRFTGEATKMSPGQTDYILESGGSLTRGVRWVDVALGGPLARVAKWRDAGASALFTQITGYAPTLAGYWSLQDGRNATQLANTIPNGRPATFTGITLQADDGPPGSAPVIGIGSTGQVNFTYAPMSGTGGYQIALAIELPNAVAANAPVFSWRTTSGVTITWSAGNASYTLDVVDSDGTSLLSATTLSGTDANAQAGRWIYYRFKVHASGTTVTIEQSWYNQDAAVFWGVTSTYTGKMGAPRTGQIPTNATTNGGHYAHHFAVSGNGDDLQATAFRQAFTGYSSELAADRFERLMASRNLPYLIRGDNDTTAVMGPQPIDTFQAQLKQIRATEGGLIFDRGDNLGIVLVTRAQLYANAADPWELTWPDDIAPPLLETTATADVFNQITASNANGSSATAELTTGRLGSGDPPAGSGLVDKKIDVNLASDARLISVATWWMRFYTQEQPRFDQIVIDVDENPGLLDAANAAEPGTFIRLSGRTPDPLILMIISCGQKSNRKRNVFTFGVVAGAVFQVAEYDGTDRYDATSSTLREDLTTTETGADVTADSWGSTWGTQTPYDVVMAGERCTVTAVTTPALVSGKWQQTLTLTRSASQVVKTQATGTEIHIADQRRYG